MQAFKTDQNLVEIIDGMTLEFPYCMHERNLTDFVVPWHWHEEVELGYIEKGVSIIRTIDQEYEIHQGNGFLSTRMYWIQKPTEPLESLRSRSTIFFIRS